jgi:hypothetical protein
MLGSNPSADLEAGNGREVVHRLPHRFRRSGGRSGGLGARPPIAKQLSYSGTNALNPGGLGAEPPTAALWEHDPQLSSVWLLVLPVRMLTR